MKKTILVSLMIVSTILSKAQNGGFSAENPALKIEWTGQLANQLNVITVTNKKTCEADITLMYNGNRTKTVPALSQDTFHVMLYQTCLIKARTNLTCPSPNYGLVELDLCRILPVTFEYVKAISMTKNEIDVQFKIAEVTGFVDRFNIQISTDGVNYKTIHVILPTQARANTIYNAKIKL